MPAWQKCLLSLQYTILVTLYRHPDTAPSQYTVIPTLHCHPDAGQDL